MRTVLRICKTCSKEFPFPESQLKHKGHGTFCSRQCSTRWQEQVAASTPTMSMDRAKDKAWSRTVRENDQNTCRRCGKVHKSNDAHHIAPRDEFPDLRFDLSNGVCLCQSCHMWVHMNPVVAKDQGWLCGVNDIGSGPFTSKLLHERQTAGVKTCKVCREQKPLSEFYSAKRYIDSKETVCKRCRKSRVRANRERNHEHYLTYDRQRRGTCVSLPEGNQ